MDKLTKDNIVVCISGKIQFIDSNGRAHKYTKPTVYGSLQTLGIKICTELKTRVNILLVGTLDNSLKIQLAKKRGILIVKFEDLLEYVEFKENEKYKYIEYPTFKNIDELIETLNILKSLDDSLGVFK